MADTLKKKITFGDVDEICMVEQAKEGDVSAFNKIISKYENLVRIKARSYFLIGGDKEDIFQEGMIGLYKAVRDFSGDKQVSFQSFAELCITRQIITAIKTATRQKHIPLNSYVSLNKPIYDEEDKEQPWLETFKDSEENNPEKLFIDKEEMASVEGVMDKLLSNLEYKVLIEYLDGNSYQTISDKLNKSVKSIDNALQRIKLKLSTSLDGQS